MNKNCNIKIGFIGCGKMAGAIIKGIISSDFIQRENIKGSEATCENAELAQERLGIEVCRDNILLAAESDVIFIATKPHYVADVLEEIKSELNPEKLVVSIAAGVSLKKIEKIIPGVKVIRVMPNTPALISEGMSGISSGSLATDCDVDFVMNLFSKIGKAINISENQIDILTAISGSGPAFFYKVIEDIARAGEKLGMNYEQALLLAAQTALGSAKMVIKRGELSVEDLINSVATKGGCTFVGVETMIEEGSSELFDKVIANTAHKATELGK